MKNSDNNSGDGPSFFDKEAEEPLPNPPLKGREPHTAEGPSEALEALPFGEGLGGAPGGATPRYPVIRIGDLLKEARATRQECIDWNGDPFVDFPEAEDILRSGFGQAAQPNTKKKPSPTGNGKGGKDSTTKKKEAPPKPKMAGASDIEQFLDRHIELRHNLLTAETEYRWKTEDASTELSTGSGLQTEDEGWRRIEDRVVNTLWTQLSKEGKETRTQDIWNVLKSEYVPVYHPLKAWLSELPVWDPTLDPDHLGALAARIHVSESADLLDTYLRKWFVGMVAGWLSEEVTNQVVFVLIGGQGIYKTTLMENLLPPVLKPYFYTKPNSSRLTKDDKLALCEFALINLEEIDAMGTAELNQLKALITMKHINERPAYGRAKEHRPHIASFCGTGNNPKFLTDPTGNRRWLPFHVLSIDSPYALPIHHVGLYSQAMYLLQHGYPYWFTQQEINQLNEHNRLFEAPNPEEEQVQRLYRKPREGEVGCFKTATEITERCNLSLKEKLNPTRIGQALTRLGYPNMRRRGHSGYIVVERLFDEIQQEEKEIAYAIRQEGLRTEDGG